MTTLQKEDMINVMPAGAAVSEKDKKSKCIKKGFLSKVLKNSHLNKKKRV